MRLVDISSYDKDCRIVLHPDDSGFPASELPTVDAVEVVRCKNCKYCLPYDNKKYCSHYPYRECYVVVGKNDFCSYGERKEVSE